MRRGFRRVRAVHHVLLNILAELFTNRPRRGLRRVGRTHQVAPSGDSAFAGEHRDACDERARPKVVSQNFTRPTERRINWLKDSLLEGVEFELSGDFSERSVSQQGQEVLNRSPAKKSPEDLLLAACARATSPVGLPVRVSTQMEL